MAKYIQLDKGGLALFRLTNTELKEIYLTGRYKLNDEVVEIGYSVFSNLDGLKSIDLNNVKIVDDSAFEGCTNLKQVTGKNLREVGELAFANCESLEKFDCDKLESIGDFAFSDCVSLKEFKAPSLLKLGSDAFSRANNISSVLFPGNSLFGVDFHFDRGSQIGLRNIDLLTLRDRMSGTEYQYEPVIIDEQFEFKPYTELLCFGLYDDCKVDNIDASIFDICSPSRVIRKEEPELGD